MSKNRDCSNSATDESYSAFFKTKMSNSIGSIQSEQLSSSLHRISELCTPQRIASSSHTQPLAKWGLSYFVSENTVDKLFELYMQIMYDRLLNETVKFGFSLLWNITPIFLYGTLAGACKIGDEISSLSGVLIGSTGCSQDTNAQGTSATLSQLTHYFGGVKSEVDEENIDLCGVEG